MLGPRGYWCAKLIGVSILRSLVIKRDIQQRITHTYGFTTVVNAVSERYKML